MKKILLYILFILSLAISVQAVVIGGDNFDRANSTDLGNNWTITHDAGSKNMTLIDGNVSYTTISVNHEPKAHFYGYFNDTGNGFSVIDEIGYTFRISNPNALYFDNFNVDMILCGKEISCSQKFLTCSAYGQSCLDCAGNSYINFSAVGGNCSSQEYEVKLKNINWSAGTSRIYINDIDYGDLIHNNAGIPDHLRIGVKDTSSATSGVDFRFDDISFSSIVPTLNLNSDLINTVYFEPNLTINYNGTLTDTTSDIYNCSLYVNNILNQTDSDINITQNQDFFVDWGDIEQDFNFNISCENFEASDNTGSYLYRVDTILPRIETNFVNDTIYQLVLSEIVDTYFNFTNVNLQNYTIVFNNGTDDVETIFADVSGQNLTFAENSTTRNVNTLGGVGNYTIDVDVWDLGQNRIKYWDFEVQVCPEIWIPLYTACTIGDNQTLLYNDTNVCGTTTSLPGDNGTISSCNYCTLAYHTEETGCIGNFEIITYPVYDNFATCCNITGIATDCDLPANTSVQCVGLHASSDIGNIFIDFLVELGVQVINYAPLIAIVLLVVGIIVLI